MASKPTQSPKKLTIQCILNILTVEDKTTLENKLWDERTENVWLGLVTETWDGISEKRLVTAKSEDEAMIKFFEEELFDICDWGCWIADSHSVRIPYYTQDIPIWAYIDMVYDELYCKYDRKLSVGEILPDKYEIVRLSEIKTLT